MTKIACGCARTRTCMYVCVISNLSLFLKPDHFTRQRKLPTSHKVKPVQTPEFPTGKFSIKL